MWIAAPAHRPKLNFPFGSMLLIGSSIAYEYGVPVEIKLIHARELPGFRVVVAIDSAILRAGALRPIGNEP